MKLQTINYKLSTNRGFTIAEILVVLGIVGLLFGLITFNLFGAKHASSLNTAINVFINDLKSQQLKSMLGGGANGIHFEQDSYTLFHGGSFNTADSTNFNIKLGDNIEFDHILFPNQEVVFASGSGEIIGYDASNEEMILKNVVDNNQKSLHINQYGVVTEVN